MNKKWLMVVMVAGLFTTAGFSQETKQERPKQDPEKMFKTLDTDADGKLSEAEVEKAQRGRLKENFAEIDTNKDKFIDKEELKAFREKRRSERKQNRK